MIYPGETAALATAVCWVICSMSFEEAANRIGSLPLNIIRLFMALVMVFIYTLIRTGTLFPPGLTTSQILWLSISGIVGLFLGDITLFKAFTLVGARTSMVVYSTVPVFTAILGFFILGETMWIMHIAGMFVAISGVILVVVSKETDSGIDRNRLKLGIVLAFAGTLGQAGGMILSKKGMTPDPFMATQIRSSAAIIMFILMFTILGRWKTVIEGIRDRKAMAFSGLGSFFGPFLGVTLSLFAIQHTSTGIASTLIGLSPILIIPPSVFFKKEKINFREIIGTLIAIGGSSMLFLQNPVQ